MKSLLLTDNAQDESILTNGLRMAGLTVSVERDAPKVLERWGEKSWDILLVALRTPDPLALTREIRRTCIEPMIMIIERVPEDVHLAIVDAGADWVMERPYSVRMLIAYTQALLRRSTAVSRLSQPVLVHDQVRLDPGTRTVRVEGKQPHRLSQLEFRLLHTLMLHRGQVLPTETIVEHVWGYTGEGDRTLVRGLINRLRAKVEVDPHNPQYIRTVSKIGYIFDGEE